MKKNVVVLISLIVLLFVINYSFLDSLLIDFFVEGEFVVIERVIDGDTVVVENTASLRSWHTKENGTRTGYAGENLSQSISVRLLGVNSPEKGEQYYDEAREFLEDAVLNKKVMLKFGKEKYDKYGRVLAYVFVGEENINLKLVRAGFANFYFPSGRNIYYENFKEAWEECSENLCEKSENECVVVEEFDYEEEIVVFYNECGNCDLTGWEIKDEGRKSFVFPDFVLGERESVKVIVGEINTSNNRNELFWIRNDYVWTNSGDTLFLRDREGKLVLWESY